MDAENNINDLENLPEGWGEAVLSELCRKGHQWSPKKEFREGFHYVDVSAVSNQSYSIGEPVYYDALKAPGRARKIILQNDILFATIRPSLRRIAFVDEKHDDQMASTAFCVLHPKKEVCPRFVYYSVLTDPFVEKVCALQHGASYPAVTDKNVLVQEITLPIDKSEQQKIAAVLYKIQKAIGVQERTLETLRELKKSTLQKIFTQGLHGKSQSTDLGPIPAGWEWKKFGDFARLHRGYDLPKQDRAHGKVPIVGSNGVVGHHDCSKIKGPGVVTGRSGTIGLSFFIEEDYWPLNTGLYVEDFFDNNPFYVHCFFQWFDFKPYKSGVSVPTLNRNSVHSVDVAIPDVTEQNKIAGIFQALDKKIGVHERKRDTLNELFRSTLNQLMTARIRVNNLNVDTTEVEG